MNNLGFSYTKIAVKAKIHPNTVQRYALGVTVDPETSKKIKTAISELKEEKKKNKQTKKAA